jgi:hypothetical protein
MCVNVDTHQKLDRNKARPAVREVQALLVQSEFQDALQILQSLTSGHERTYRLAVGQYILQRFFAGQAPLYQSHDKNKQTKFASFLAIHAADLAELDLSEQTLRRCVRVNLCYDTLPPAMRDKLSWSALLAISSVPEPNQRARLAAAAVRESWPVSKVKEAVALAGQNRLWDAEPEKEGLQLPAPKPEPLPQPGRLVTQTEKWTSEVQAWRQEFARIDPSKLNHGQIQRMREAIAALRGQIAELEKSLVEPE